MRLPYFSARKKSPQHLTKQEAEVFAKAKELATLRLEQCLADLQIVVPSVKDASRHPLRKLDLP